MTYWRMQLHPDQSGMSIRHCVESLTAGYIGLDFASGAAVGDLLTADQKDLPNNQKDYWLFAHEMAKEDVVLIMAHHFPFALAIVYGSYNYMRHPSPEIGVWFRHFREVRDIRYYGDYVKTAHNWQRITMTNTISPLRSSNSESYKLIEEWLGP